MRGWPSERVHEKRKPFLSPKARQQGIQERFHDRRSWKRLVCGGVTVSEGVQDIYIEAWLEPRKSIRRVRGFGLTERDRLLMVAVNLIATAITIAVMVRMMPTNFYSEFFAAVPATSRYISYAVFVFGLYWLGSFLLRVVGHACGGVADAMACRDVISWWMLVTAVVSLIEIVLLVVLPAALSAMVNTIAMIGGFIIFATYTAEVHGFTSVGRVAAVTVATCGAVLLVVNFLILSLASV